MEPSRVLLALQEQEKWRERRKRVEERLRQVRSRRRYLAKELETARRKIAQFGVLLAGLKGRAPEAVEDREEVETRLGGLGSLR